jgi:hypothetical protein
MSGFFLQVDLAWKSVIALSKTGSLPVWTGFAHVWKVSVTESGATGGKMEGPIIKRRVRFREPALEWLPICIVLVFAGFFVVVPVICPFRALSSANGKL